MKQGKTWDKKTVQTAAWAAWDLSNIWNIKQPCSFVVMLVFVNPNQWCKSSQTTNDNTMPIENAQAAKHLCFLQADFLNHHLSVLNMLKCQIGRMNWRSCEGLKFAERCTRLLLCTFCHLLQTFVLWCCNPFCWFGTTQKVKNVKFAKMWIFWWF